MKNDVKKVHKRFLIVEDERTNLYIIDSLRAKFDEVIIITDYIKPVSQLNNNQLERLPVAGYTNTLNPNSEKRLKIKNIDKVPHAKVKELELGENNAYFVVGKKSWYYLRDFHGAHIGLRNTVLDWQVPHLTPFTMGTNKFVMSHTMTDEHYKKHIKYFFDDEKILDTVKPLNKRKVLSGLTEIKKALSWATSQPIGTNFGLDYETNGLWKYDKYEKLEAIGVGLATKEFGFYCEFRDLSKPEMEEFKIDYKIFLDKHANKSVWVMNVSFEMMVTRKLLGAWAVYDFKDIDIFRIIDGNQVGYSKKIVEDRRYKGNSPKFKEVKVNRDQYWSLKFTAQKMLKVGSWDNDFEKVESKLFNIFKGFQHDNISDFLMNPIVGDQFKEHVGEHKMSEAQMSKALRLLSAWKKMTSVEAIEGCFAHVNYNLPESFMNDLRIVILGCSTPEEAESHPYWNELLNLYPDYKQEFKKWMKDPRYFGNNFAIQPSDIVGGYCILDSYYTVMCAEKFIEEDKYTNNPHASCDWANTQTLIDVFAANKCLGAKLDLYGLYKSNTKRMRFKDINDKVRVFNNYIIAQGYLQLLLDDTSLKPHENESKMSPIFKSVIKNNGNPMDFGRVTKVLFPLIYNPDAEHGWDNDKAQELLGDLAEEIKDIMLDHKPGGFINKSAHSRALNLHKETALTVEEAWEDQMLPNNFDWKLCQPYYTKIKKVNAAKDKLRLLNLSNIKGKHIDEVLKMDSVSFTTIETIDKVEQEVTKDYTFNQALGIVKKQFFDIKPQNEIALGQLTEKWKEYKILLFLYHPLEYKPIIDRANIFDVKDPLQVKISKFHEYIKNCVTKYEQPVLSTWEQAREFSIKNNFPDEFVNPDKAVETEPVQANAYIDSVISEDLNQKYGLSKGLLDQYMFYRSVDRKMINEKKAYLLETKHMNPISYKNWIQEVNQLDKTHDNLILGDYDAGETLQKFLTCDVDINDDHAYVKIAQLFKLFRKTDKINTYPDGQLIDSDLHYLGEDIDGVPQLAGLTKDQRNSNAVGDSVKMFPRYSIMQKLSKRSSTGIHTVPSRSEVKGIITAPKDKFLVYTDISSLELRGISAISGDPVMEQFFNDGLDIYTEAAYNYHVGILNKDMTKPDVRKKYRRPYKGGVISSIYGAGDWTLSTFYEVPVHEVKHITASLFGQFKQLKKWQGEQLDYAKRNDGRIRTWLGDVRKLADSSRVKFQAVNLEVQGTSSVIGGIGFGNLFVEANKKKMLLTPAISVHDAIISYSNACDIELLYDHYQEHFYEFLAKNYHMKLPFDLEIACNYWDKIVMEKGSDVRHYTMEGTHKSIFTVLERAYENGKRFEFIDKTITMDIVKSKIDSGYNPIEGAARNGGNPIFEKDFSYGKYEVKFID